jgi:hypothetical protein
VWHPLYQWLLILQLIYFNSFSKLTLQCSLMKHVYNSGATRSLYPLRISLFISYNVVVKTIH